ncbi:MAG: DUF2510 domain-containing protein [Streptosporangiaceae bacterium]|jgi:hypothetical protein
MEMPPPGWYEDPVDAADLLRWWDGTQWTEHNAPAGNIPQAAIERAPVTDRGHRAIERAPEDLSRAPGDLPGAAASPMLSAPVGPYVAAASPAPAAGPPPSNGDDPSLTDWFQSIPYPVAGMDNPALANSTRVLERGGPGTLAEFGWPHGTPVTEDDTPLLERNDKTGPLLHNRTRLMWGLALGTAVAMLITGILAAVFGSSPAAKLPAAAAHPSAVRTMAPKASAAPSAPPSAPPSSVATTGTPVTDTTSGLTFASLAAPWQAGCPSWMNDGEFSWSAGEAAQAGTVASAGGTPWYGIACSGLLSQQVPYTGVADLPQTATTLAGTFDSGYDNSLPHDSVTQQNNPLQVSGHPAWIVEFQQTFQNAAAEGLAWQTALNAVVVVDRGTGQMPAMLYVSVPDNLGTANVGAILASLQLNAPAAPASPGAPASPTAAAPPAAPAANGAAPGAGNP